MLLVKDLDSSFLFRTPEITFSRIVLGCIPCSEKLRASSAVTQRPGQRRGSYLVSLPEIVRNFLSQLYKNTSFWTGRALHLS